MNPTYDLNGRVVLVTGLATARSFARGQSFSASLTKAASCATAGVFVYKADE
jgi:hypothetical protein